ncbi:uncharacterized protein K452DRAFT_312171 [Aplosporella prunicola CBS 121167]|uniref:Uncharacterized protein n=1 Tax=Aplosporella prunicola CBS 121167 TaxID=1176127 RepID=A0A6A6B193_9PEZI|nr:uncharacterized protein K452DRAFT_312171 [Aplosporella prunicola CBS 121167]KAF2137800.1 hypothetical protein K452DRAFT_312171 [Aplosporella prunicola CBS 121167]
MDDLRSLSMAREMALSANLGIKRQCVPSESKPIPVNGERPHDQSLCLLPLGHDRQLHHIINANRERNNALQTKAMAANERARQQAKLHSKEKADLLTAKEHAESRVSALVAQVEQLFPRYTPIDDYSCTSQFTKLFIKIRSVCWSNFKEVRENAAVFPLVPSPMEQPPLPALAMKYLIQDKLCQILCDRVFGLFSPGIPRELSGQLLQMEACLQNCGWNSHLWRLMTIRAIDKPDDITELVWFQHLRAEIECLFSGLAPTSRSETQEKTLFRIAKQAFELQDALSHQPVRYHIENACGWNFDEVWMELDPSTPKQSEGLVTHCIQPALMKKTEDSRDSVCHKSVVLVKAVVFCG